MRATDGSGDARGRVGLELESGSVGRKGNAPTGGARLPAAEREGKSEQAGIGGMGRLGWAM